MKKLLILLLAVLLLFSFASCVKDESTAPSETETDALEPSSQEQATAAETVTDSQSQPDSAPAENNTGATELPSQAQTAKPETVTAAKPQPDIDDKWGVALTFDCKDGKGGRLTFTQSTEAGRPDGELITGAMYKVEAKDDGYWTSYENYVRTHYDKNYKDPDLIFTMIAYSIPLDGEYSEDIDFTNTYGELKPGTYRIVKTVTCGTGPQREERTYYAEFTVE